MSIAPAAPLMSPEAVNRLHAAIATFCESMTDIFGEGNAGEALLGVAIDHMIEEGKTELEIHSLSRQVHLRATDMRKTLAESRGEPVVETQPRATGIAPGYIVGKRVTGVGDDRALGVTWCESCRLVNPHDDLGVCKRCVGPLAVLLVPIADVARVLEQQGINLAGNLGELNIDEMSSVALAVTQSCWPLAPFNFMIGLCVGRLIKSGVSRQEMQEMLEEAVDAASGSWDQVSFAEEETTPTLVLRPEEMPS